jgi:hypothetical protein
MISKAVKNALCLAFAAAVATSLAGCRVQVDKDANGQEKNVQVDTPFGGVHVNTDQVTATDLGLSVYPGAKLVNDNENHKSADVHMGFGEWQMRVRAVSYSTNDSQDKVTAFYKKELGRYGDVITCQGNTAVGTPSVTSDGLNCGDSNGPKVQVDGRDFGSGNGLTLKAGSKRHQHILGFENPQEGQTRFALVALDLPATVDNKSDHSD